MECLHLRFSISPAMCSLAAFIQDPDRCSLLIPALPYKRLRYLVLLRKHPMLGRGLQTCFLIFNCDEVNGYHAAICKCELYASGVHVELT